MRVPNDLYVVPQEAIDFDAVRQFVLGAEAANALTESLVLELKSKLSNRNVVEAVAGMANASGGIVLLGVDEKTHGEGRLVGVPSSDFDRTVTQLRALLSDDAMPELVPVAVPESDGDRIILVIRVSADDFSQPVVVSGKVVIRAPGQTVPATRDQIIGLVEAERRPTNEASPWSQSLTDAARFPLWKDGETPRFVVRSLTHWVLPKGPLRRAWLDTRAKEAVVSALERGPVTRGLLSDQWYRGEDVGWNVWDHVSARSDMLHLIAEKDRSRMQPYRPSLSAATFIKVSGRRLEVLVGIGCDPIVSGAPEKALRLGLRDIHEIILGVVHVGDSVCRAIAESLDASRYGDLASVQVWLQPTSGTLDEVLDLHRPWQWRGSVNQLPGHDFWTAGVDLPDVAARHRTVSDWLTQLLLDLGLSDFDDEISRLTPPPWATVRAGDLSD